MITAAGNAYMHGIASCFRNNGERKVRLIGTDMNVIPAERNYFDETYIVPRADSDKYADALLEICKKEHVDVLIPVMSAEIEQLSENKARFEKIGTVVAVSDPDAIRIANNKIKLFNFMTQNGLPCAKYGIVNTIDTLKEVARDLGHPNNPLCVKIGNSSGSRGFRIIDEKISRYDKFMNSKPNSAYVTLDELIDILKEADAIPELMLMEYLPGEEYSVDALADHGKLVAAVGRICPIVVDSINMKSIVHSDINALEICAQIIERLNLHGNIGFDFKADSEGKYMLMEINPRVAASISTSAAAGVNLPYLCAKLMTGEIVISTNPIEGTVMERRYMEFYYRPDGTYFDIDS